MTIDGGEYDVPEDRTVLEACRELGIEIPTLCEMRELAPDGSCRRSAEHGDGTGVAALHRSCLNPGRTSWLSTAYPRRALRRA
ncbi:(2Fe-2S)-binding protein, partial [Mycobacterium tuberculosis]|nr:(2Fe-2S)-binding protein [Mycobacterium tuberculosis]